MVISKKFISIFSTTKWAEILDLIQFDPTTREYFFNEDELHKKKWIFAAIDDNSLDIEAGELDRLIAHTKESRFFYCANLNDMQSICNPNELEIIEFKNIKNDWLKILSPYNQYTLWESILFDHNFTIFIIKPWSVGYNTLICSSESLIRNICTDTGWIFNKKHPICPII